MSQIETIRSGQNSPEFLRYFPDVMSAQDFETGHVRLQHGVQHMLTAVSRMLQMGDLSSLASNHRKREAGTGLVREVGAELKSLANQFFSKWGKDIPKDLSDFIGMLQTYDGKRPLVLPGTKTL